MTQTNHVSQAFHATSESRAKRAISRLVGWLVAAYEKHEMLKELEKLDQKTLRDVGLIPYDITRIRDNQTGTELKERNRW